MIHHSSFIIKKESVSSAAEKSGKIHTKHIKPVSILARNNKMRTFVDNKYVKSWKN